MSATPDIPLQTPSIDASMSINTDDAGKITQVPSPIQQQSAANTSALPPRTFVSNTPIHTGMTHDVSTPTGYFKWLLAALPTRYLGRGIIDSERGMEMAPSLHKAVEKKWGVIDAGLKAAEGSPKEVAAKRMLSKSGYVFNPKGALEKIAREDISKNEVMGKIKNISLDHHYDNFLGVGSFITTALYERGVYHDIKDMFSETVAYETGKQPEDITFSDLRHSDNDIVKSTLNRFYSKSAQRFASDLGFFGKQLARLGPKFEWLGAVRFGDIMIGVKGAQLLHDVSSKHRSIFEDIVQVVDNKLNPVKGLGESVTPSDIIDLYQKYSLEHNPEGAFKDATIYQRHDDMEWPQAEQIFIRAADLMNQTYKYKHSSLDDMTRRDQLVSPEVDFTLPKFLYMLGENQLDARKPEVSYARLEIAAHYGSNALKDANEMLNQRKTLDEVIEKYPVDINPVRTIKGHDGKQESYADLTKTRPMPAHQLNHPIMHEPLQTIAVENSL